MKLRILSKREQTRRERVLALTAETKQLTSEDKTLKVLKKKRKKKTPHSAVKSEKSWKRMFCVTLILVFILRSNRDTGCACVISRCTH